jgi:hypothetical protein
LGSSASPARASFGIAAFDGEVAADAAHAPFTQAGGHPYVASSVIEFNQAPDAGGLIVPDESAVRNVDVDLPPGLIGNPTAVPVCKTFLENVQYPTCSPATQVGVANVFLTSEPDPYRSPIYRIASSPGTPASFGFSAAAVPVTLQAELRDDGDYGITVKGINISQGLPVARIKVEFWGTPADPAHDNERGYLAGTGQSCARLLELEVPCSNPAGPDKVALLTNPTSCTPAGVGLRTDLRAEPWRAGVAPVATSFTSHNPPGFPLAPSEWGAPVGPTGCEQVPFDPQITVTPTTHAADSPTGLEVEVSVPDDGLLNPDGIAQSHLKKAVVTLPEGMTVNPASAVGLGSCSPAQLSGETSDSAPGAGCPLDSKVGTVEIQTPLLDDQVAGSVFLAKQNDNPFDSLLALYIVAKSAANGVAIKLPGRVEADPATGQLTATFDNNPQLPFSHLHVSFKGGSRAPLITPRECGDYRVSTDLTPWARPNDPVHLANGYRVTSGPDGRACPSGSQFDPSFEAGTLTPIAGAYSPLIVNASRPDGSQPLSGLKLDLPQGLVGKLAGIPYCPDSALAAASGKSGQSELASSSCPSASKVGSVDVAAGAGATPFHVQGQAYLAGPYKGAPLSIAVITPAVAGPFDLGTVVVRAKADVDPATAQIHVVSDPIPTILQGIPLKIRSVSVNTDRPDFTLNPTDCSPMSFSGVLLSPSLSRSVSNPFQVGACKALDFKPKLAIKLSGPTHRSAHPALKATLTMPKGNANIQRAAVTLPKTEFLEQSHIRTICTRVQYAAKSCPKAAIYGYAKAWSPLLDKPLEGPVYLRSSNNPLPDLVASLDGQIQIDLSGRIDSVNARIRNTFDLVPDAPVSKFVLTMQGGKKGLLVNNTELCKAKPRASVKFDGQNGKVADSQPLVKVGCGKAGKRR